jgi:hypothetical protein
MFLKLMAKNYKILLSCYKWKRRLLILVSPRQDTRISQLDEFIATHQTDLNERFLIIKRFTIDEINFGSDNIEQTGFWLIGYDGNIKGHGLHTDFLNQIFSTIDEMPIRMQEKKL